jgi:predicted AAA+ superfamily ATPase
VILVACQKALLQGALPGDESLVILDEIHKYKGWRNLVKGFYDSTRSRRRFLITGSARLDHYMKRGRLVTRTVSLSSTAPPFAVRN